MQLTRNSLETAVGRDDWFTGDVYIDTVATAAEPSRLAAASVHFTPGARTAWHTHPLGQTIYVTDGVGRCQRRGGDMEIIRPVDRVYFEPGEDHWHGAALDHDQRHAFACHLDGVGVAQLVRREAAPNPGRGGRAPQLRACCSRRPVAATRRAVDDAQQGADGKLGPQLEPGPEFVPSPRIQADLA